MNFSSAKLNDLTNTSTTELKKNRDDDKNTDVNSRNTKQLTADLSKIGCIFGVDENLKRIFANCPETKSAG